ncbi:MAG TPA: DUF3352 domain-containing protein [Thermoleophilaceae bacterium]|nr:DUF3352 domain-containing protein [Thermoleophilaceae bacterium]
MRRLLAAVCTLAIALAAAGCGGGSSDSGKSPLDNALGYLPKSAPVVAAIDTNLNDDQWKSLGANVKKFPFAGQVESSLKTSISQSGLDFDKDIKPLLGNDFVVGFPTVQSVAGSNDQAVAALEVKDKGKLSKVLSNDNHLTKDGSSNGATLYRADSGGTEVAQDGNVLVVGNSKQQTVAALEQRGRDDRLTQDTFNNGLSGLPSDALARVYVNAQQLIAGSPGTQTAQKVKWVAALRTVGVTVSSESSALAIDFNAKTDSSQLSDADLPFASGDASPPVSIKPGEIGVGIRGVNQTEHFIENVAKVVSPASYANFLKAKQTIANRLGLNIDKDLIDQLSGNTAIAYDINGKFAMRADPKDPAAFRKTLARAARVAPQFARGAGLPGAKLTRAGGLYKLTGTNGKTLYYGMVGSVFAASNDPVRLTQIASATPQQVTGAKGAVSINADVAKIVAGIISQAAGGGLGGAFGGSLATAPLGNLTGSITSGTSGLTGHLQLAIR